MFLYWKKRGAYELGALPPALAGMEYGAVERFSWSSSLDISEQLADEQCPAEEQGLRCQNPDCTDKRRAAKVGHGVPAVLAARAVPSGRQQACCLGADLGRWRLPWARPGSQCLWCWRNRLVQLAGRQPWGRKPCAGRMRLGSRERLQPLPTWWELRVARIPRQHRGPAARVCLQARAWLGFNCVAAASLFPHLP
ncbi:uncharacterized protein LOC122186382 isoform X2 [Lagopus leucura]|uniref:uncharacterized protein LOC122186382 isoform X2 n=1 Tax=Lagopus leucura TaxID=30410 RepID=UPI001C66DF61|nr:uncharacterized protein LOC122186382 isoform X2 [Lagopus leucura]